MDDESKDTLVMASEEPDVSALIKDFQACAPISNGWHVIRHSEDVRFCRWPNQSVDGRKHSTQDEEAKPWEGASDVRVFLVDAQVREDVAILVTALFRAIHAIAARGTEATDDEQAARLTTLLKWALTRQKHELLREAELSAQYLLTYGVACLHPRWSREIRYVWKRYELRQLEEAAQAEGQEVGPIGQMGPMLTLLNAILDPAREAEAVAAVQGLAGQLVAQAAAMAVGDKLAEELLGDYQLSERKARKAVRELRTQGFTELPVPYVCKNDPEIKALKVYEEVFFRNSTVSVQHARIHHLEWLTEAQLKQRAKAEKWDADWVERAVKTKGKRSQWSPEGPGDEAGAYSLAAQWGWVSDDQDNELIEVCHSFYPQVDEDGIACNAHTIFSLHFGEAKDEGRESSDEGGTYALHEMLPYEHNQLPYVIGTLESISRRLVDSRGYPELLATAQREVKVQRDALIDSTSLSVVPPINKYAEAMDTDYVFGPGAQNITRRGMEPQMMEIKTPGVPAAFNLMEVIQREVDQQFGSLSDQVNPVRAQAKKQMLINTFLRMWSEAFTQQFALMQQFTTPEEFQRITGGMQPLARGHELGRGYDVQLAFDARELDMEQMKTKGEVMQALFAVDRNGIINTDRFIQHGLRALNPSLAEEIIDDDKVGATEKIYREVQNDLLNIMGGFQPKRLVDADPTAPARLRFAQEILQRNPKMQQALQTDPVVAAGAEDYIKNLQFAAQQSENRAVGRTGVK